MPTLILSRRYTNDSNALWRAALARGWDVERLLGYECPRSLAGREPLFHGETLLADAVCAAIDLALLEPDASWLPALPEPYRRRQVRLATLAEARALRERAFVKPVDEKWFPARVYASGAELEADSQLAGDLGVLVAEPVRFSIEWRVFVLERRVAAVSPYLRHGDIAAGLDGQWSSTPEELAAATSFTERLLADIAVRLPPAVVVDVGEIDGRGWAVVEANACWAAGLCGCDPDAVLDVLRRAAVPRSAIAAEDAPWVRALPEGK